MNDDMRVACLPGLQGLEFSPEVIRTASQMDPIFRTKNSSKDQTVEWGLVRMEIDGKELLLDENSQLLYRVANSGQPVLCGKLSASGKMEVFAGLSNLRSTTSP